VSETALRFQFNSDESQRLDVYLAAQLPDLTRSRIQSLIKNGFVLVEGQTPSKTGYKLDRPLSIEVTLPALEPADLIPEDIQLNILYEDAQVIVLNKPAGMVVHPSLGHSSGTLIHAVLGHAPDIEGVGGVRRPGLVHRLDKNTSGVIILAKNDSAHLFLQKQFKDRQVIKTYLALVEGHPKTPEGRIEAHIGRDTRDRKRMAIVSEDKGKLAISEYRTKESFAQFTLLEVDILTGRTHQIRVHLAFIHCPVVGDTAYGRKKPTLKLKRHFLHAERLSLTLPDENEARTFNAPLPNDLAHVLANLRKGH
jgi:23S rRNA pseudouridine1911/1915/1917 synthase